MPQRIQMESHCLAVRRGGAGPLSYEAPILSTLQFLLTAVKSFERLIFARVQRLRQCTLTFETRVFTYIKIRHSRLLYHDPSLRPRRQINSQGESVSSLQPSTSVQLKLMPSAT